ncbi:hypothetical protein N9Y35_01410 [Flavobacteriales bacterium]|jgi:hypothetical protein|nr:hypothetical protein [Flavobacteriales bacterium]
MRKALFILEVDPERQIKGTVLLYLYNDTTEICKFVADEQV